MYFREKDKVDKQIQGSDSSQASWQEDEPDKNAQPTFIKFKSIVKIKIQFWGVEIMFEVASLFCRI